MCLAGPPTANESQRTMANAAGVSLASLTFGGLLRHYRAAVHMSQQALADRAGISLQAVAALENGRRKVPYRDTLERLATALELSPSERSGFYRAAARKPTDSAFIRPRSGSTNLPRQFTSLVGRAGTIAE